MAERQQHLRWSHRFPGSFSLFPRSLSVDRSRPWQSLLRLLQLHSDLFDGESPGISKEEGESTACLLVVVVAAVA